MVFGKTIIVEDLKNSGNFMTLILLDDVYLIVADISANIGSRAILKDLGISDSNVKQIKEERIIELLGYGKN